MLSLAVLTCREVPQVYRYGLHLSSGRIVNSSNPNRSFDSIRLLAFVIASLPAAMAADKFGKVILQVKQCPSHQKMNIALVPCSAMVADEQTTSPWIKAPWHSKAGMCLQGDAAGKLHQPFSLKDSAADACELQAARHKVITVAAAVQLNLSMTDCTHT